MLVDCSELGSKTYNISYSARNSDKIKRADVVAAIRRVIGEGTEDVTLQERGK